MADLNLKIPAVEKLLEFVVGGIGAVGGPLLARWKANREADAARIEAQGQADVMRIKARGQADSMDLITDAQVEARNRFPIADASIQGNVDIGKEIESRLMFQEQKRQSNIGAVVRLAADELGDKEVQNHDVDHDWVARFFSDAQDVTSEHMQRIWAKILAGEVETPGRTSLHTLSILKNMSQRDAELFEEISRFVFHDFIFNVSEYTDKISEFPRLETLINIESYGLLHADIGLARTMETHTEGQKYVIGKRRKRGKRIYRILRNDGGFHKIQIPAIPLSPQGRELHNLGESIINEKYLRSISRFLNDSHASKLEYAEVLQNLGDHVRIGAWIIVEPL